MPRSVVDLYSGRVLADRWVVSAQKGWPSCARPRRVGRGDYGRPAAELGCRSRGEEPDPAPPPLPRRPLLGGGPRAPREGPGDPRVGRLPRTAAAPPPLGSCRQGGLGLVQRV